MNKFDKIFSEALTTSDIFIPLKSTQEDKKINTSHTHQN